MSYEEIDSLHGTTVKLELLKHDIRGLLVRDPFIGISINGSDPMRFNDILKAANQLASKHNINLYE